MNTQEPVEELLPRALTATRKGQRDEAIRLYEEILGREPEHEVARNNLGCLLVEADRVEEAVDVLESFDAPASRDCRSSLGYALLNAGDMHRAEAIFRDLLAEDPEDSDARNHLGMVLLRRKRVREAVEEFLRVSREYPQNVAAWNNLGCAHQTGGDLQLAKRTFEQALHVDPYNVDAHNNLGCVLRDLGHLDEAVEELQLAVSLEPRNPAIQLNLALCFHRRGETQSALNHLRRHLRYDDGAQEATEIHRLLHELEGSTKAPTERPS